MNWTKNELIDLKPLQAKKTIDMNQKPSKAPIFFGGLLILIGLCLNEYFINPVFYYETPLTGSGLNRLRFISFLLGLAGILILVYRKKSYLVGLSKNMLLLLSTIGFIFIAFELMFSLFLGNISVGLARFIPFPYRIISQSSKTSKIPDNHIAIFGDSHAVGAGDWYLDTDPMTRDPYHVAHLLHNALDQDVLSFGRSGASSLSSMVAVPIKNYRILGNKYNLKKPDKIVVYFYAGNDVTDNLADLTLREPSYFEYTNAEELNYQSFSNYIENVVIEPEPFENLRGKFVGLRFLKTIVTNVFYPQFEALENIERDSIDVSQENLHNQILRKDQLVSLPPKLQSPALELNQKEWLEGLKVFSFSLKYMQSYFNEADIYVVYLPSVLASYQFEGDVSAQVIEQRNNVFTTEALALRSDSLQTYIKSECDMLGINFVDTREAFRNKSDDNFIHGPKDWKHPNKLGYQLIANEIATAIKN